MNSNADNEQKRHRRQVLILVVLLLITGGVVFYQIMRSDPSKIKPVTRRLSNFVEDWRCLKCGHALRDNAGQGPRKCPKCSQEEMYVSIKWSCPTHGPQPAAFQYDEEDNPTKVKIGEKDWVQAITQDGWNIHCPVCNASMGPPAGP